MQPFMAVWLWHKCRGMQERILCKVFAVLCYACHILQLHFLRTNLLKLVVNTGRFQGESSVLKGGVLWVKLHLGTGMRRITTFRSTTGRIYDSGPIRL
jgi:hypothetical protein